MLPKNCGKLLYNAVRETLETMAFADVVPCSIKVAGEEFAQDDDFAVMSDAPEGNAGGWGDEPAAQPPPADAWGTATPDVAAAIVTPPTSVPEESWGDSPEPTAAPTTPAADDWGTPGGVAESVDDGWGEHSGLMDAAPPVTDDPWGDSSLAEACASGQHRPKEADFDAMITTQTEWCWACMKVNSPDVHSVWFIITRSLAHALMENMYAGEDTELDTPVVRDLIAELTNVLGGRLMLLLEEMGGKFTLTVPDIGFGLPDISEAYTSQGVVCKVVVDCEHPIIVALCFNPGGVLAAD
jgi:hypothetical protein